MFIETLEFTIPVDLCDLFISLKKGVNSNVEFPASVNSYGTTQDANIQVVMRSNKLTFKVDGVSSNASMISKSECKTLKLSVFDVDCSLLNEDERVVEHEVSMISNPITHSVSHTSKRPRERLSSGKHHNAKVARTSLSESSTPSHISHENSQSSSETDSRLQADLRLQAEQVNVKQEPDIIEIEPDSEQYEDSKPSVQDLQRSQEALDRLSHPQSANSSFHQNVPHVPDYAEAGPSRSRQSDDYVVYQQSGDHGDDDYGDNNDNSADFGIDDYARSHYSGFGYSENPRDVSTHFMRESSHYYPEKRSTNVHTSKRQCPLCNKMFKNYSGYYYHKRAVHENMTFPCSCGKEYRYKASLYNHQKTCPITGSPQDKNVNYYDAVLASYQNLRERNLGIHSLEKLTPENPFQQLMLTNHLDPENSSEIGNFPCPYCSRMFAWNGSRFNHIQAIHQKVIHACACGRMYHYTGGLKRHKKCCPVWAKQTS